MTKWQRAILLVLIVLFISAPYSNDGLAELGPRGKRYKFGGAYIGSDPSMSLDGSKIVFGSTRYGLGDICSVNSDGTNWMRLTKTPEYEGESSFSPDGDKIVFVSERDGNGEIYVMNSDGANQTRLTHYVHYDANPSFSPDGSKIVFSRNFPHPSTGVLFSHLFIMNCDGTEVRKITYRDAWYYGPRFSPDGKKIIFKAVWQGKEGSTGIGMINVDGSNEVRMKKCSCFYPSFSPNGKKVIFVVDWHDQGEEYELWTMSLDSEVLRRIPLSKNVDIVSPVYVQGGKRILFLDSLNEKGGQICIMNEDGTNFKTICNTY